MISLKNKNYPRWGVVLLLLTIANNPGCAISETLRDSDQSIITRAVVRDILKSVPLSVKKICVLEMSFDGKTQIDTPLNLNYLDNRIVTDDFTCSTQSADDSRIMIMYTYDVRVAISHVERPPSEEGELYDRIIEYLNHNSGDHIASATFGRCDADIHVYAFRIDTDEPKLTESTVIGKMKCRAR